MDEPAGATTAQQFIRENYFQVPSDAGLLQNGHIIYICLQKKVFSKVVDIFEESHSIKIARSSLMNSVKKFKSFHSINKAGNFTKFKSFCDDNFSKYKLVDLPLALQGPTSSSSNIPSLEASTVSSSKEVGPLPVAPKPITPPKQTSGVRSLKRIGKLTPVKAQMQKRIEFSEKRIEELKTKLKESKAKKVKDKYHYWRQTVARKESQLQHKKDKIAEIKKTDDAKIYRRKYNGAQKMTERLKKKITVYMNEKEEDMRQLKEKNKEIFDLQNQVLQLEEKVQDLEDLVQRTSEQSSVDGGKGKPYNANTRQIVYQMLDCSVPTEHIPVLMKKMAESYGVTLANVPHPSTVQAMAREMGVISDYITAEFAVRNENLTLGFDATTQEGVHVNSIHITSKSDCKVVALDELPGGTAVDYSKHIEDSLTSIASIYSKLKTDNMTETRLKMINNISNTITDRAVVNHATIVTINESWNKHLNELNCHLHPLDSIATDCKKALKKVEEKNNVTGKKLYGSDCSAAQLVLAVSKLRFKDGAGDPKTFKTELTRAGLPKGFIPRYRGNRLHVLFLICGKLIEQEQFFTGLFSNTNLSSDKLRRAVSGDFNMDHSKVELRVLGLIGKLLTGPWMSKFYVDSLSELDHMEAFSIIKSVIGKLHHFIGHPEETLKTTTDFFEDELSSDDGTVRSLQTSEGDMTLFNEMMASCLSSSRDVLLRQYERYFDMDVTNQLLAETRSARLHNIDAEQIMGMFSALQKAKTNASVDFISCAIRARKNNVLAYLDSMPDEIRSDLINSVRPLARQQRSIKRKAKKDVETEVQRRIATKKQKKDQTIRKKLEKDLMTKELTPKDFPENEEELISILEGKLVGQRIIHMWYEEEKNVAYHGKVEKYYPAKKRRAKYVIAYWQEGQSYDDDAEDFNISPYELAVDLINEDLVLT